MCRHNEELLEPSQGTGGSTLADRRPAPCWSRTLLPLLTPSRRHFPALWRGCDAPTPAPNHPHVSCFQTMWVQTGGLAPYMSTLHISTRMSAPHGTDFPSRGQQLEPLAGGMSGCYPSAPLGPAGPLISQGEPSLPDTQPHHRAGHSHTGVSCRIQSHLLTPSFLTHCIPLRPHPRASQRLVLLPSLQDGSHHHLYFDESSLRRQIRHFLYKSRGCKGGEAASGSGFGLTSMKMYLVETSDSRVE